MTIHDKPLRSIDACQLSLAIHGEPAMQQNVESLAWEARRMAVEVCKKRGQPLDPFQEVLIQDAIQCMNSGIGSLQAAAQLNVSSSSIFHQEQIVPAVINPRP